MKVYAQYEIPNPTQFETIGDLFTTLLPNVIIVAGFLVFFYLVFGGFKYLTAGGDEKALTAAKQTITNAIIGLLIIFAAYWIIWILQIILGVEIVREFRG